MTSLRDRSRNISRPHKRDSSNGDRSQSRDCSCSVRESYDNFYSSYGTNHGYLYHDRDRSHCVKRGRDSESPLSHVSKSGSSDGGDWKSKSKRHKPMDEDDLTMPWMCEEVDSFTPRIYNFKVYQKKYVKDPVEIHNIKQKDEETIRDFMEWFKVETKRIKRAPECMRISGFMHRVNNPELTKHLNEHVPKTMEEMMITTTAFIRGKATAAGKKKDKLRSCHWSLVTSSGTEGLLVIEAEIGIHMIQHLYVDGGSSTKVLYEHYFNRLRLEVKNQMVSTTTSLTGFSRETIWPLGQLRLLVTIREADHSIRAWMNFMIVRSLSSYNGIIGRPRIKEIQAVPSTAHIMLKFPTDGRIVTIHNTILIPAECATVITSSKEIPKRLVRDIHPFDKRKGPRPRNARRPSKQRYKISKGEIMRERLVDKAFDSQIGQNIEVYVDDLVIKSHIEAKMLRDIGETFWIKLCPNKTEAVLQLPSPRTIKKVQSLNGKLASLNRFLSKSAEKSLPLFKTLNKCIKKSDFHWTSEAKQAFKQLKQRLSELPCW
nr:reverse transcriptase domain-containing protein [Tanacetum cinerariifolium]